MERYARAIVIVASALVLGQYLFIAGRTIGYPFQLEWMEGGVVDVVARVSSGDGIYVPPSVDYVPYLYPPLYFIVTALVSTVGGVDFAAARWVSFAALLGTCLFVFQTVRRETRRAWLAFGAVALFVATYELTGRWFHLARVDTLCVFLLVAAFYPLRFGKNRRSALVAAALLTLAFLTKQTALIVAIPLLLSCFFFDARRAAAASGAFVVAVLASMLLLGATTDGWFFYYTVDLPAQHELAFGAATAYLLEEGLDFLPALLAAVVAAVLLLRRERKVGALYVGLLCGGLVASLLAFAHTGGYLNVLMPGCLVVALVAPLLLSPITAPKRVLAGALGLAAQLYLLTAPTAASIPPHGSVASGERFVAWLADRDGEVLVPDMRFIQTRAGHRSHGLGMAARDVLRADPDDRGRRMLTESLAHALSEHRFSTIVLSQQDWLGGVVGLEYGFAGTVTSAPLPVTGLSTRPVFVWVVEESAP